MLNQDSGGVYLKDILFSFSVEDTPYYIYHTVRGT